MKWTKQLYVTTAVALAGFSCQDQTVRESMASNNEYAGQIVKNEGLFAAVPLNAKKVCGQLDSQRCSHEMQQLQLQLMTTSPIPVPQAGEQPTLSVRKADALYRQFVADHANEPIVSVFRQLYARAMLNQFGVLASNDYELIRYYVMELVDEESADFATLAEALARLQHKTDREELVRLINSTAERAQAVDKEQKQYISELTATASQKTAKGKETPEAIAARIQLAQLNQSTLPSDVKQLTRLQSTARGVSK